jgi:hypothetical protein
LDIGFVLLFGKAGKSNTAAIQNRIASKSYQDMRSLETFLGQSKHKYSMETTLFQVNYQSNLKQHNYD